MARIIAHTAVALGVASGFGIFGGLIAGCFVFSNAAMNIGALAGALVGLALLAIHPAE